MRHRIGQALRNLADIIDRPAAVATWVGAGWNHGTNMASNPTAFTVYGPHGGIVHEWKDTA